ncbi:hypothetical protein [Pseudoalteromonas 'SMAR']|uniref:hypothetical protein n=1 Tax=Pseudoalteromonas 'SMAR' TaxID=3416908 RepID=UPI003AF2DF51
MAFLPLLLPLILIKTSLLGLGMVTIALAAGFSVLLRLLSRLFDANVTKKLRQLFTIAMVAHLLAYLALIIKLLLLQGWQDIPMFIASHIVIHHVWCGLTALLITVLTLSNYHLLRPSEKISA